MTNIQSFDPWSSAVIILTGCLFVAALVMKGFTHDLFLEAGVLLVSIKLILMAQKNARTEESLERHLARIEELLLAHTFSTGSMKQVELHPVLIRVDLKVGLNRGP